MQVDNERCLERTQSAESRLRGNVAAECAVHRGLVDLQRERGIRDTASDIGKMHAHCLTVGKRDIA